MSPSILPFRLSIPKPQSPSSSSILSFSSHLVFDPTHLFLISRFTHLSISSPPPSTMIRMGGGPRTYPGGVSKWQWKRMQAKKAKQLLRARLARERQIYEMRKRAELTAAVSELERPWEVVEKAPKLFSVTADEQLKVLADRFQKPGGFDLWSEKDGPQLFEAVDGIPSARFFPKGVVHSIKPYGRISDGYSDQEDESSSEVEENDSGIGYQLPGRDIGMARGNGYDEKNGKYMNKDGRRNDSGIGYQLPGQDTRMVQGNGYEEKNAKYMKNDGRRNDLGIGYQLPGQDMGMSQGNGYDKKNWKYIKNDGRRKVRSVSGSDSGGSGLDQRESRRDWRKDDSKRGNGRKEQSGLGTKVFDMNLQDDGSYGVSKKEMEVEKYRRRAERK